MNAGGDSVGDFDFGIGNAGISNGGAGELPLIMNTLVHHCKFAACLVRLVSGSRSG